MEHGSTHNARRCIAKVIRIHLYLSETSSKRFDLSIILSTSCIIRYRFLIKCSNSLLKTYHLYYDFYHNLTRYQYNETKLKIKLIILITFIL